MSKVNWVCATCGQDFTRSYSANRHNNHFHYGKGIIVRFLEYVIGRINGQFHHHQLLIIVIHPLELLENGGITTTTTIAAARLLATIIIIVMVFIVMMDLQPFQTR
jgi:hypothetical protein